MKYKLNEITEIYYGPYGKADVKGDLKYFVSSHFDDFFEPTRFKDSFISKKNINDRYLLKHNDVIITGKGHRIFAWAYKEEYGEVIPSSLFYIIKINEPNQLLGDYLAIYLNSNKVNHILKSISGGTSVPSIQKKELGLLDIYIPTIAKQKKIIEIAQLMNKDVHLAKTLTEKKKTLNEGILNELITKRD